MQHLHFGDIVDFLDPKDSLVVNQTRVMPARLVGCKADTGAQIELLLVHRRQDGGWLALGRPSRRLKPGHRLEFGGGSYRGVVRTGQGNGRLVVDFDPPAVEEWLDQVGQLPLPPYISRTPDDQDAQRYQTVFAQVDGAVAAPTAGLHFSTSLLEKVEGQGTAVVPLVLHVGPGTFAPIRSKDPRQHRLEAEFYQIDSAGAELLNQRRQSGGRTVAVGTTAVRTLETVASECGQLQGGSGWTQIYIYPPYQFKAVDALVTNFHLPGTTLLLLVAAFAGGEFLMEAYRQALARRYRFYSYGDAMLIV